MTLADHDRQALIENYRDKGREMIQTVEFLLNNDQLTLAVNRIYYGIYYMLSAIALKEEFTTSQHAQLIGWFNKTYVKDGRVDKKYSKIIQKAFEKRMKGDYDVFTTFTNQDVAEAFEEMKEVIAELEKLL